MCALRIRGFVSYPVDMVGWRGSEQMLLVCLASCGSRIRQNESTGTSLVFHII